MAKKITRCLNGDRSSDAPLSAHAAALKLSALVHHHCFWPLKFHCERICEKNQQPSLSFEFSTLIKLARSAGAIESHAIERFLAISSSNLGRSRCHDQTAIIMV